MITKEMLNHYGAILFQYDIRPTNMEDWGKVKKIYANQGTFALKETSLSQEAKEVVIHSYRKLERLGFKQIVPIYPTKYGEYLVSTSTKDYYLMPWIEEEPFQSRVSKEEIIIDQMGIIHRLTAKTEEFSKEAIEESYKSLMQRWELRTLDLQRFAEVAESRTYMSPFELAFLTHYHHLMIMVEEAKRYLTNWYEQCIKKEKYRTVLCHGKLSRHHTMFTERGEPYIFNFERASMDTPARDIALFCRHSFGFSLWNEEEMLRWFQAYERHLPLLNEEKELLMGYLSFPEPILFSIQMYNERSRPFSELQHVQRLERRIMMMRKVQRLGKYLLKKEQQQQQ